MYRQSFFGNLFKSHPNQPRFGASSVRWLMGGLWVLLISLFTQPSPLFADSPLVTLEINYHMPEAGEVFLVWGIDGWQPLPDNQLPQGTILENGVMHTLMTRTSETFLTQIEVPAGATLNYGFQIRSTQSGIPIEWVWDGDYTKVVSDDSLIVATADFKLINAQEIRYHQPEAGEVFLVWGLNGWATAPDVLRPTGTIIKDNVMHTKMERQGEIFVATIQVPGKVTLDYGFLVTQTKGGIPVEVWEGNSSEDFHTSFPQNEVIAVESKLDLSTLEATPFPGIVFVLLIGLSFILTVSTTFFVKSSPGLDKFISSTQFRRLIYLRDLLREMVARDMKLRYKRSVLGVVWSLINPLVQLVVLQLIFGLVLNLDIPNYSVFLFTGLLVWTWFQSGLFSAAGVIVDNPDLIKRPGFPVAILPIVTVTTHLVHFLLALPVLFGFLIFSGVQVTTVTLVLPLIILLQFLLTLSLSYFVAAAHVNFRDTQYLLGIILLLGFYLSPIFYNTTVIPEAYHWLYYLNPMVSLIEAYRTILMQGQLPNLLPPLIILCISIIILILGHIIFTRVSYKFVEEI